MRSVLACLGFVVACGARTSTPPPPARPAPTPVAATPAGPTDADCEALFAHALALTIAARLAPPSDADVATVRSELRAGVVADCRSGSRAYYECGMRATTRAALAACK